MNRFSQTTTRRAASATRGAAWLPAVAEALVLFILLGLLGAPSKALAQQTPTAQTENAALDADAPPGATPRSAVRGFLDAVGDRDYEKAADYLDLSRVDADGAELARQLEVVLDKTIWIDLSTLSDARDGVQGDGLSGRLERIGTVDVKDRPVSILLSHTQGANPPAWRFAAETVSEIPSLYQQYGYGPLGTYLPDVFFELRPLDLQLWQWFALIALVLVAGILSWAIASAGATAIRWLLARRADAEVASEHVSGLVAGPARLLIGVLVFSAGRQLLGLALAVAAVLDAIEDVLLVVAITWAALRLIAVLGNLVEHRLREQGEAAAVALVPPGRKTLKAFVLVVSGLAVLDSLGFNVTAVLAGLGVGGIAVALAAQKTVENLFGGATLYADRPVRVGDFCRVGDKLGNVEEIGLRSTRVRTLDRTVISIPNAEFANVALENFALRDKTWYHPRIGLRYETSPDQLRYVLVEVRKMLYAHPKVDSDPARIRFVEFGAYSLDLDIFAYVNVTDYGEFLEVAEDLNLRIMDIVEEAGTGFAFPSQTLYVESGEPLDAKRQDQVGDTVDSWRDKNRLYLPRFPEEKVRELRNTLEFPPRGSPAGNGHG